LGEDKLAETEDLKKVEEKESELREIDRQLKQKEDELEANPEYQTVQKRYSDLRHTSVELSNRKAKLDTIQCSIEAIATFLGEGKWK